MESRAKVLGHPAHPILIVFPLGLLATAVIIDVLYLVMRDERLAYTAFVMIAAGCITGAVAAIFGFWDWLAIPNGTRAKSVGAMHGLGNVAVIALFIISLLLRRGDPNFVPSWLALIPSFLAFVISAVTGWLGGELVDRLGVGVDEGAHLNAPNSLSGQPASANAQTTTPARSTAGDD